MIHRISFTVIALFVIAQVAGAQEKLSDRFVSPQKDNYPETWFHYIDGNVDMEGITKDLEAIAGAGISGIHLFHGGQFGGDWPGVKQHIECLSPYWNDAVKHTAQETERLGLRFTMQNCPGWSLAGGPWIEPENAMRDLVWSRKDVQGGKTDVLYASLPLPKEAKDADWRDYRDIAVIAFLTPEGDNSLPKRISSVTSDVEPQVCSEMLMGKKRQLEIPAVHGKPHFINVEYEEPQTLRSIVLDPDGQLNHNYAYELNTRIKIEACLEDGRKMTILDTAIPMLSWQHSGTITFALDECTASKFVIRINNPVAISLNGINLITAARQNNWEAEAAWALRSNAYECDFPRQSASAYIDRNSIIDLTDKMDADGRLVWDVPAGKWTVLRFGHVNKGRQNSPAPEEATGWECDKLSTRGAEAHFAGYIGKLVNGPAQGCLDAMLLDSWECESQTWTGEMEKEFLSFNGYELRKWLPAVTGYVIDDTETTARFLHDWRSCINYLFVNRFWGRLSELAHDAGIQIVYETAAGDVFPADILEYFKFADIPMCEFWNDTHEDCYVGSINFKPVKPTASAARLYGKSRVDAESLTSFNLTWDEHFSRLKDVLNQNYSEGVTHSVFHTYTHNPCADTMFPGTSFGSSIGTPFLRGQTWWKHMPELTTYLARLSTMQEAGKPVSAILWYLGDGSMHKPDQRLVIADGFKYDYCSQDALINRISVKDGRLLTPEGISWDILWLPDNSRMLPATAARLRALVEAGATIVGDAPKAIATLVQSDSFEADVAAIWPDAAAGIRKFGKGRVVSGMSLKDAIAALDIQPDILSVDGMEPDANWLHRSNGELDWYFISSKLGRTFKGTLDIACTGSVSIWDPVSGTASPAFFRKNGNRTFVDIDLPEAGSCFVVFDRKGKTASAKPSEEIARIAVDGNWTLSFPDGWGAPAKLSISSLQAWKDLPISEEGKAFSGTAGYSNNIRVNGMKKGERYILKLGKVEEIAKVSINGKEMRTIWCEPYEIDITDAIHNGSNSLRIEVTSTWFNRLVYDASQAQESRKTWVISGPDSDEPLRDSGLIGPVYVSVTQEAGSAAGRK